MKFLEKINLQTLIDSKYGSEKFWPIVHFLGVLYWEQSRIILRRMITPTLTERVRREGEIGWSKPNLYDQIGFVALVGILALSGVEFRIPFDIRGMAETTDIVAVSQGHPKGGHPFVEAGLRRLALV